MQKTAFVFPIIGGRKPEHLLANVEALELVLTDEHIKYLESVVNFDPGFPNAMIVSLTLFLNSSTALTMSCGALGKRHRRPFPQALHSFGVGTTIATYPPEQVRYRRL